ncbi:girdin homolog [Diaphorina citri]|uniref:Girdin homolog n=1 Tax=Diaphorina citri TaxID=121845 RepID=A0A3Q0J0C8_DIACI|nr:girdin homolog [Diaphorina citri]
MAHNSLYINNRQQTLEQIQHHEKLLQDVILSPDNKLEWQSKLKDFKEKDLKEAIKQSKALLTPSSAEEGSPIKDKIDRLEKETKAQSDRIQDALKTLNQLIGHRKEFEVDVENVEAKLKELEVAVEGDVKTNNVLMLQELLNKYAQLNEEAGELNMMISNVSIATEHMNLNDADRLTVNDSVSSMQKRYAQLSRTIEDRISTVNNKLQSVKRLQHKVEEAKALLQKAESQLARPVSTQAEDISEALTVYQKLLDEINSWKNSQSDEDLVHLADSIKPLDEVVERIENHAVPKLKSLLLLREQFTTLIMQIVGFITETTARVGEVDGNSATVQEKIDKYDKIIADIQEYEAILATASDKGDQLSSDGTISDRNEITEQLQSRKQQLHNLRKTVEKLRQQNEKRAAESEKLGAELEEIIEALHARETAVKTLPVLLLEVTSVDVELDKQRVRYIVEAWLSRYPSSITTTGPVKKLELATKEVQPYVQRYETLKKNIAEAIDKFETQASEHEAYKQAYNEAYDWLRKAKLDCQETLKKNIAEAIDKFETQANEHEAYKQAYNEAYDWLRKAKLGAQANADCHGEQQTTKDKADKIKQITKSLPEGQKLIDKTVALKNNVLESTGPIGKENINQEINQITLDWTNLQNTLQDIDKHHAKCLSLWNDFLSSKNTLEKWIEGFQKKIESEKDIGDCTNLDDLEKYKALLQEGLHKEADNKKVLIDSFNKGIIGMTELESEEVKDLIQVGVHGLQVELNALLQNIEAEINKVANAAQERKAMQDKISKLQSWLKQVTDLQLLPTHEPLASIQCQVLFNTAKVCHG